MKRGQSTIAAGIVAASEAVTGDGAPATRIKLLPVGRIEMRDGRGPFLIRDQAHAQAIVAATQKWLGGADFNFDYDHQTAYAVQDGVGGSGVAAGWAAPEGLTAEADGIYANDIRWTAAAEQKLRDREYRYISPMFYYDPSKTVLRLRNAGLVNVGAIDLPAVAAGLSKEDDNMELTAIAAALGLAATATVEEIAAAATALKSQVSGVAVAAGLAADADIGLVAASVTTLKAAQVDLTKFVPAEQVAAANARLSLLEGERAERVVGAAISDGKLVPALKDWALKYFKQDEAGFSTWLTAQPQVLGAGALGVGKVPPADPNKLADEELAACSAIGMSPDAFLAEKKLLLGAAA